jgi:hypothetical protein
MHSYAAGDACALLEAQTAVWPGSRSSRATLPVEMVTQMSVIVIVAE